MSTFTVTAFHGRGKPWGEDKDWGPLVPRRLELDGVEGIVEWSRKPDSPDPKVGDVLEGEVEKGQYGSRFKAAKKAGFGGGKSPEQQKSIVRQHSQEMALRYMVAKGITEFKLDDDFRKVIDWFQKDAGS